MDHHRRDESSDSVFKDFKVEPQLDDQGDTEDYIFIDRCKDFMHGYVCNSGDFCKKLHRWPRDDGIICEHFLKGTCRRQTNECWFVHPHTSEKCDKPYITPPEAPRIVQPLAELFKYLRSEEEKHPGKYDRPPKKQ